MIHPNSHDRSAWHWRSPAFVLVITISLTVLLTIIAVGLLSLSAISLRSSRVAEARARAQAHARLALLMAVSRLQELAGPDQRVTASAELAAGKTKGNRHWIGVWSSTVGKGKEEIPVIRWDPSGSAIIDGRSQGETTPEDLRLGWLVSGKDPDPAKSTGASVTLVGTGSVDEKDDYVDVPLVGIERNGRTEGRWAFWVGDQSTKACVNLVDRLAPAEPSASDPDGEGYRRLLLPQTFGIGKIDGLEDWENAAPGDLEKVTDYRQAELVAGLSDARSVFRKHFHDLSTSTLSVLSDPMRGGLKRDLTVFLENGAAPGAGALLPSIRPGRTPLLTGALRQNHGPKLDVLKSWYDLRNEIGTDFSLEPRAAANLGRVDATDSTRFRKAPQLAANASQPVHPVIAFAELYTRMAYVRGYLTVHLYPRIVLWNPWNCRLAPQTYTLDFNQCLNDSMTIEKRNGSEGPKAAYDPRGDKSLRILLELKATAFDPGEALVFSPVAGAGAIAGRAVPFKRNTKGANLMSAEVDPRRLTNFYIPLGKLTGITARDLPVTANHNKGSYYWIDMMDWWERNNDNGLKISLFLGSARNRRSALSLPLLQSIDTDNWRRGYEGGFNNGRWKVGGRETVYDYEKTADFLPWTRTNYGFRLRWWKETNPQNLSGDGASRLWQAAVSSDFNIRAAFCHHSPYDNITDNGEAHHWYIWGPYACERVQGLPYDDRDLAAHPGANGFRANVLFAGSKSRPDHVYPMFDVPLPGEHLVSLGSFQHTQLSRQIWQPNYAVGSSWVPPTLKDRARSADPPEQQSKAWSEQLPHLPAGLRQNPGKDTEIYDLAFEANYELWDRFFLSGATTDEKSSFAADPSANPLANTRLVPAGNARPDKAALADFYKAASQVVLAGGFNVNSTSVPAWQAFLSATADLTVPTAEGDDTAKGVPFPRFRRPPMKSGARASAIYSPGVLAGFRRLSEEEIKALAEAVVEEVRKRGPFLSVADFVNRRLVHSRSKSADTGLEGTLQAAIESANRRGLNYDLNRQRDLKLRLSNMGTHNYEPGDGYNRRDGGTWANPKHMRKTQAAGLATYLQQGDILQSHGSLLVARGDTFLVRAYGEATSNDGKRVLARAWCEAVVQRTPEYIDPADDPWQPAFSETGAPNDAVREINRRFGRRFNIVSFRWLGSNEI